MSKRKPASKRTAQKSAPSKTSGSYDPSKWLDRASVATEQDSFYRKIFMALGAVVLLATIVLALGSGINGDDEYQDDYSAKLVSYYSTMGADTSALHIPKGNMQYYGGFFDIVTGFTNKALGLTVKDAAYHDVRHVFNAVFGFVAMLFTALFAREIGGWRAGILTLAFMFLSPRFLGHSLMNPKDIPFAAGYIIAIYYMSLLFKSLPKFHWKLALGVALGMALAIATRAGGLILVGIFGLFAGLDFLMKNGIGGLFKDIKQVGAYAASVLGISLAGFLIAILFWPYAMQDPIGHPLEALGEFSKLGVKIRVLFGGENLMSDDTPWHYALQWIWRTIPLFTLFGFLGAIVLLKKLMERYQPLPVLLAIFAAVFPVFYIIAKDSILHDGWRHLMFVYPTMVVTASLFWLMVESMLTQNKTGKYALYAVVVLMMLEPALFIARNPHYPYVYFNTVSGGISGAFGKYETDYWGVSMKQALDWLEDSGKISPDMPQPVTIATTFSYVFNTYVNKKYGDKIQVKYVRFNQRYETDWDYGIFPSRYIKGPHLRAHTWPNSRSIHTVDANGVPLLSIEQGGGPVFEAEKSLKGQDLQAAINGFQQELTQHPDNEIALTKLAMAYLNTNQAAQAKDAADKLLQVTPDNTNGLFYRGLAYLNLGDAVNAEKDLRRTIEVEDDFGTAYYYLALIENQRNDISSALEHLQKAIQAAPNFKQAYELGAQIYEKQGDAQRAQQYRAAAAKL
ncbi:MAG: tetratricopeptide repeat protein [Lewinellaceae bacterium]|nr:tetratricopeptide repeat protein [Saprospiraceae bacterium]MCB9340616.1 tetratricopeptide repeat protein [Lewinellaceae bacterium]